MSLLGVDLKAVGLGLASRVAAGVAFVRRTTGAVALLRLLVAGSLLGASALTLPLDDLMSRAAVLPVGLALVAALFPRTHAVSVAVLLVAAIWLFTSTASAPLWKVLAMVTLLYLAHASAAFASVLPHDCVVAPSALRLWARRTALVVVVSTGIGAAGLGLTGQVQIPRSAVAPIAGSLVAIGMVALLTWQLRRRA
jgi:hypothetical protein